MPVQMSLFENELALIPASAPTKTNPPKPAVDPKAEYAAWTTAIDEMIENHEETHLWFLKQNLRILNDPQTGDDERADILIWVNAPTQPNDRLSAFSFQACLWLYDPRCDVSAAQTMIQARNQRVLKRQHALTP